MLKKPHLLELHRHKLSSSFLNLFQPLYRGGDSSIIKKSVDGLPFVPIGNSPIYVLAAQDRRKLVVPMHRQHILLCG